ncbi:MAG: TfoX family protein [Flavobacteriales bacterium]|nr:MAG: TfoX family protein [Flavobacteriales bacterium]
MAFDPNLENKIVKAIMMLPDAVSKDFSEKRMFGGIAFLYKGKMTVGIVKDDLMVRVINDKMQGILDMEHVRPMDFTKRPMKEFVFVSPEGFESDSQRSYWLQLGLEHAQKALKHSKKY